MINKLNYYEYICENEKHYIAAYSQQQADGIYMLKVMTTGKAERDTWCNTMLDERAKLLELFATEPGLLKVVTT